MGNNKASHSNDYDLKIFEVYSLYEYTTYKPKKY